MNVSTAGNEYDSARQELVDALKKKKQFDKQLNSIESEIYANETSYLEETNVPGGGNVVRGFDGFLKQSNNNLMSSTGSGRQSNAGTKRFEVTDNQRIFSNSSDSVIYKD
ncbi:NuA4-domain-containing protein [Wallemia mellicola CBS 633.66]|uniref:Chromatin modification-related protein EAF6 n=1 Tax=Wallemia mellicola (strain ATCC MYA-4683 / CBS 633.66) TaxID=671144 RepID=I4Y6N3_WALMC|nr:NuA4-domain-containing protein [Wallemia mellicola CBS 633.66]EIM19625.1 NuA4-domain-containing protein [Wallemia mellicola CBS 633.66]|eukprot:XP_006960288.1 NuA4-domain-containing protein [Wallemia mellicola CBS 633.66]